MVGCVVAPAFVYQVHHVATPFGNDPLKYIWRARLVGAAGIRALARVPAGPTVEPDHPGLPLVASIVHGLTGVSSFRLMFLVPGLGAGLLALAAAAFALLAAGEPPWAAPVYALAVGASINVALLSVNYLDNLLVAALLLGCAVCCLRAAAGRAGRAAAGVLFAGAVLTHWEFSALFAAILVAVGVVLVPESVAARRGGTRWRDVPAARLLAGPVAGGAAGLGILYGATAGHQLPGGGRLDWLRKSRAVAALYRLPVTVPAAGIGAVAMVVPWRRERVRSLVFCLVWGATVPVAYAALHIGAALPAHRFLAFALAIPVLVAAGLVGLGRGLGRIRVAGPFLGGAVLLAGLALWGLLDVTAWNQGAHPVLDTPELAALPDSEAVAFAQAATAGAYVARYAGGRPPVYVVGGRYGAGRSLAVAAADIVRDAIPVDQIPRTAFYLGDPANLLRGRPTVDPAKPHTEKNALHYWSGVRALRDPVIIRLRAFVPPSFILTRRQVPSRVIAPGVELLRGPLPPGPLPAATPPRPVSGLALAALSLALLLMLGLVGSGWAWSLLPESLGPAATLAPALGLAALVIAGSLADRLGFRMDGPAGAATAATAAVLGWAAAGFARTRRRNVAERPMESEDEQSKADP